MTSLRQMTEDQMLSSLKRLLDLGYLDATIDVCGNGEYTHHITSKGAYLHTSQDVEEFVRAFFWERI